MGEAHLSKEDKGEKRGKEKRGLEEEAFKFLCIPHSSCVILLLRFKVEI